MSCLNDGRKLFCATVVVAKGNLENINNFNSFTLCCGFSVKRVYDGKQCPFANSAGVSTINTRLNRTR